MWNYFLATLGCGFCMVAYDLVTGTHIWSGVAMPEKDIPKN